MPQDEVYGGLTLEEAWNEFGSIKRKETLGVEYLKTRIEELEKKYKAMYPWERMIGFVGAAKYLVHDIATMLSCANHDISQKALKIEKELNDLIALMDAEDSSQKARL